jgi:alkylation response protein AidB-like acyl-CoA dehydrogenase
MAYRAPLEDHHLLLKILGFEALAARAFPEVTPETVRAVLEGAALLAEDVLAPLNRVGDLHPARLVEGKVRTSPGFAQGFAAIAQGGWIGMAASPDYGGLGLPMALTSAVNEFLGSACLALQLNPLMTQGQIEALEHHASPEIRAAYIPNLISGRWTATMNLTEPGAGSDVGALRSLAEPLADGTYAITGEKIFITWADHDFAENICHLVLARLPGAPEGTKGISLFMVPKVLDDGSHNRLTIRRLEEKLGLHGSPTGAIGFEGAKGWLIGQENRGMAAMFTMMNNARLGVGLQGVAVAEAAWQQARDWAATRVQGRPALGGATIDGHPDVRRMLYEMRAETFSARAIAMACAVAIDARSPRAAFLTPLAKACGTETGHHVAQLGIQVHGGAGFIEETGAAQLARDVRVTSIYEGTNGIQALDLVGRKMADDGAEAFALIAEMQAAGHAALAPALGRLAAATRHLLGQSPLDRAGAALPYLRAYGQILGTFFHLQAAAQDPAREALARFAVTRLLPRHEAWLAEAAEGASGLDALPR